MSTTSNSTAVQIEAPAAFEATRVHSKQQVDSWFAKASKDPDGYWLERAHEFEWFNQPTQAQEVNFDPEALTINWFADGCTNLAMNCLRHAKTTPEKTALIWQAEDPNLSKTVSFAELQDQVSRLAAVLKSMGVKKGDRITLYMPMIVEAAVAMLACSYIGAVHSVVFGGFAAESLASRIKDSGSSVVITADAGMRGGKVLPLKTQVDQAYEILGAPLPTLVVRYINPELELGSHETDYHQSVGAADKAQPEVMNSEDPLFLLYTSGSTGKPKGVLHTTAGYMVYAGTTFKQVFDAGSQDVFWCTADVGWITGHSYLLYGPLLNGVTTLLFEGVPSYPDYSRFAREIDRHGVSLFYTAPTAIRALMRKSKTALSDTSRSSLRLLGSVGEPINPEAWRWYFEEFGLKKCPIVDTWWQTETGGVLMTPLPGSFMKPGAAMRPLPGIEPVLLDPDAKELEGSSVSGLLALKSGWPGQMRGVWQDQQRFIDTYYAVFKGYYFSGDGAYRDSDSDYWITGRVDDVLNVSGHRLGTAEIESALVTHPLCAEAAVIGVPDDLTGEAVVAFVLLAAEAEPSDALHSELIGCVRSQIGPVATPKQVVLCSDLPKTRSGKIMRRILRKMHAGETNLGDTSTLADPQVLDSLKQALSTG